MWTSVYLDQAERELRALPAKERNAILHAVEKLETVGPRLGYPHVSAVHSGGGQLRELRPRAGRRPWRVLYQRVGEVFVIAAVAPEAQHDLRGFGRAVQRAGDVSPRSMTSEREVCDAEIVGA